MPEAAYEGARSKDGWDTYWQGIPLPTRLNHRVPVIRAYMRFFRDALPDLRGKSVIEVGCCPGRWMVHFATELGASVTGIDYTPESVEITRRNLELHKIDATCLLADIRDPELSIGPYDVVFSMGVVEHYRDLAEILQQHARLVFPGGRLVITTPNFAGMHGRLLRRLNRPVYDEHYPYSLDDLDAAGRSIGLSTICRRHLGGVDLRLASASTGVVANALAAAAILGTFWLPIDGPFVSAYQAICFRREA